MTHKSLLFFALLLAACSRDAEQVSLGLNDYYYLPRMQKLMLKTAVQADAYRWTVETSRGDSLVSTTDSYIFLSPDEGEYHLRLELDIDGHTTAHRFPVVVIHEQVEYSPYTARVYEYRPAPGQFVNTMPIYEQGDTEEDMRRKAEEDLVGDVMITLGGYGGYVTFGFDHTVANRPDSLDFFIKGNAFYSSLPEYSDQRGGSSEPGIVMVSLDINMNHIPDDPWYELAGSDYHNPQTLHHYKLTYHRPTPDHEVVKGGGYSDYNYIRWHDSEGQEGYMHKNTVHTQDYFPKWIQEDSLCFTGTRLPPNGRDESGGRGNYYVLYALDWGYADNHPNQYQSLNSFDISWAVDQNGQHVDLPGADFIRVYTGVHQDCGQLGETSTEVLRATDLHLAH
jgi:hypothetical protein